MHAHIKTMQCNNYAKSLIEKVQLCVMHAPLAQTLYTFVRSMQGIPYEGSLKCFSCTLQAHEIKPKILHK